MAVDTRDPLAWLKEALETALASEAATVETVYTGADRGSFKVNRKGTLLLNPTTIEIVFTPPIDASQYTKDQVEDLMARVRSQIEAELALPLGEATDFTAESLVKN